MFNYRAFYEFTKAVICPETTEESRWIKNEGNDPADKVGKIKSAIELMEIILTEENTYADNQM